jgi:riboflavin kinase / FMN adenylyltransferase
MKIIHQLRDLENTDASPLPIGLTIGNFDGVHRGHQSLLKKIKSDCLTRGLKFVVATFVPHPQKILQPSKERFLITSYEKRRQLLESLGVDFLIEFTFTRDFSTLPPEEFLKLHLLSYSGLREFYLGYDFAFGANKQGGHDLVTSICRPRGIGVETQAKFEIDGSTVSSSLIRAKINSGELSQVQNYLGRPYTLEGVVVKGEGRGKQIGFPTANIRVSEDLIVPQRGVYVTRTCYRGMTFNSITNVGHNPTFKDTTQLHIETNLFDFESDIYGEMLEIQFLQKLRDEKKFSTVNELIEQIRNDVVSAKTILSQK